MRSVLEKYSIDHVWHFTDQANIELIVKHQGILSLAELKRSNIEIPVPGGNEWSHDADKRKGVDEFVHLAFVDDHPMLYAAKQQGRIVNPLWLKIEASVLLQDGVRFCAGVSNKTGVAILDAEEAEEAIDFDVLFTRTDWRISAIQERRREATKSEILVPNFIPIDKILGYKNG